MNTDKMVPIRTYRILDTNIIIKVNDTMVKQVDKFIYLGSEINSEGKTDREINRKILNCPKLYQIYRLIIMELRFPKQCKTSINYMVNRHLTYNSKIDILTK
jgi:hypothetical protein